MKEVLKAISQTNSGKVPGMDGIPAEIFKSAGPVVLKSSFFLLTNIWEGEEIPKEFRDTTVISLFKNKGSKTDCGNYRDNMPEAQCGFQPNRSTADMIFAMRQIKEKCIEQNMDLYAVFIDLIKTQ
ncbi:uncharacterized protein LOC143041606 [Oratosquilla oratoria]|uniref:uncharacterized protein LOC143041606 n=1 Tax=Oratosquilla oratoria TaxID=337810 RepID=UPI003F75B21A